ncbi:hypothetical protein NKH84_28125 [Mesorhizobium sp. M0902]|uniref:hypothetical protein n=1 Tax=unclassified Mesorhizobium TaxID=325217 RepID=UPI003339B526
MTIPLPDNALVALKEPAPPGAAGKEAVIAAEGRQCKGAPLYHKLTSAASAACPSSLSCHT